MAKQVAALGLDAAEWWVVEKLMDEGQLPNLAALRQDGATCRLENVAAYRAEIPWTQFATGREPTSTGYWTMMRFDPDTYDVWESGPYDYADSPPFWADFQGERSIVLDVPQVRIHDELDAIQITAWGSHSPQYPRASDPRGLLREIDERFGAHPGFEQDNEPCWFDDEFLAQMAAALEHGATRRLDILEFLTERYPDWSLLVSVMAESHSIGHHCWHGIDERHPRHSLSSAPTARRHLESVYRTLDEQVGRFRTLAGDDATVVVFSVHGMRPNAGDLSGPLLAELFHRLTFGEQLMGTPHPGSWKRAGFPAIVPEGRWTVHAKRRFHEVAPAGLRRWLHHGAPDWVRTARREVDYRLGRARRPARARFGDVPIEPEMDVRPTDFRKSPGWQVQCWYSRYWPQMRWFALPAYSDAHVRINLAGRERFGTVAKEDYVQACEEVEATLRACTDPRTGLPAIADVLRVRADDPFDPEGPDGDLVVIFDGPKEALHHPAAGTVGPLPNFRTGEHSSNGFALFAGPDVPVGADLGARRAVDLTATLVALAGRGTDARYDGEPILELVRR